MLQDIIALADVLYWPLIIVIVIRGICKMATTFAE